MKRSVKIIIAIFITSLIIPAITYLFHCFGCDFNLMSGLKGAFAADAVIGIITLAIFAWQWAEH